MDMAQAMHRRWFGMHHDGDTGAAIRARMAHAGGRRGRGPFGFGPDPRGGFGFGRGPFGGFPFGRGPKVRRGDVRAAALALLAEQPRNGYQIIQEIGQRSGGLWQPSPGSVYPALQQLEDEGLIRAEEQDGRRLFHLTDAGRAYVESHKDELKAPWDTVTDSVADDMLELRSLIGQVAAASMQVAHTGTTTQVAKARQVLNDARRSLYRILADGDTGETL